MQEFLAAATTVRSKVRRALLYYERLRTPQNFTALKRTVEEWEHLIS